MPDAPRLPCLYPGGCGEYAVRAGRCEEHARQNERQYDAQRGKTADRGYDATWRRFRFWFIARHPVCEDCERYATKEVHHVKKLRDHPELRCVEANCRALCKPCHAARTARGE